MQAGSESADLAVEREDHEEDDDRVFDSDDDHLDHDGRPDASDREETAPRHEYRGDDPDDDVGEGPTRADDPRQQVRSTQRDVADIRGGARHDRHDPKAVADVL